MGERMKRIRADCFKIIRLNPLNP
ncbi:MAG: hypothetical protein RIR11_2019, partial [Bacteroidota bacterium]